MASLPNISLLIQQCILQEDLHRVFVNPDYSVLVPHRHISVQNGTTKPKTIPLEIHEHMSAALGKMFKTTKRVSPSSSISSQSDTSTAPSSTATSQSLSSTRVSQLSTPRLITENHPPNIDHRIQHLEARIDSSAARMDSIEQLCRQLKTNTDIISQNMIILSWSLGWDPVWERDRAKQWCVLLTDC
jgi:hypothetical protein